MWLVYAVLRAAIAINQKRLARQQETQDRLWRVLHPLLAPGGTAGGCVLMQSGVGAHGSSATILLPSAAVASLFNPQLAVCLATYTSSTVPPPVPPSTPVAAGSRSARSRPSARA